MDTNTKNTGLLIAEKERQFRLEMYGNMDIGGKFKIGTKVRYKGNKPGFEEYFFKTFTVGSVSLQDEYEYSLNGFPYLVWESELEYAEYVCHNCGTPVNSFLLFNNCRNCASNIFDPRR